MKKKYFTPSAFALLTLLLPLIVGCATTQPEITSTINPAEVSQTIIEETNPKVVLDVEKETEEDLATSEEALVRKGFIFAKTDFQGVVKTAYVTLLFEHLDDPKIKYNIYIGDKSQLKALNLNAKTVEPGYFLIELPEGTYKISTISIPVGTTLATENLDIRVDVVADKTIYAGTLQVIGTKQKIKLGGVPVIKPGFEFVVNVLNEKVEALSVFDEKFPDMLLKPMPSLMILSEALKEEAVATQE